MAAGGTSIEWWGHNFIEIFSTKEKGVIIHIELVLQKEVYVLWRYTMVFHNCWQVSFILPPALLQVFNMHLLMIPSVKRPVSCKCSWNIYKAVFITFYFKYAFTRCVMDWFLSLYKLPTHVHLQVLCILLRYSIFCQMYALRNAPNHYSPLPV